MHSVRGLVLIAACAAGVPHVRGQEPNAKQLLAAVEQQLKDVAETAGPSIATVVVSRSDRYPKQPGNADTPGKLGTFDPKEFVKGDAAPERLALARALDLSDVKAIPDHGYAGGVVIDADGYVLTPYHVIDGATKVYVFLPGGVGSYADVHAADSRADLAVLKLINPPPKLKAIKLADVRTRATADRKPTVSAGTLCVLMANPYSSAFGLDRPAAAFGSVTSVRRKFPPPDNDGAASRPARYAEYAELLEYDLKTLGPNTRGGLNAGITGGVLLNLDGEMIGLTNAAAAAWGNDVGPGYAVPADEHFKRIVSVLRRGEEVEYGFLGVRPLATAPTAISPIVGGAAALAGVMHGHVITKVNGIPVGTFNDLLLHVGSALAGSKVKLTVAGLGREQELTVTLTKFAHGEPYIASARPDPVFGLRVDYTGVETDRVRQEAIPAGVAVREVVPDSLAAKRFKPLGDDPKRWVVTAVNGTAVAAPAEFYKAAKGQEKIKLSLLDPKDDTRRELTLP